jgi:hypothetical protein
VELRAPTSWVLGRSESGKGEGFKVFGFGQRLDRKRNKEEKVFGRFKSRKGLRLLFFGKGQKTMF